MTDEEHEINRAKLDAVTAVTMGVIAEMIRAEPSLRHKMPDILKTAKNYIGSPTDSNSAYQKTLKEELRTRFGNLHYEYGGSYDD